MFIKLTRDKTDVYIGVNDIDLIEYEHKTESLLIRVNEYEPKTAIHLKSGRVVGVDQKPEEVLRQLLAVSVISSN